MIKLTPDTGPRSMVLAARPSDALYDENASRKVVVAQYADDLGVLMCPVTEARQTKKSRS